MIRFILVFTLLCSLMPAPAWALDETHLAEEPVSVAVIEALEPAVFDSHLVAGEGLVEQVSLPLFTPEPPEQVPLAAAPAVVDVPLAPLAIAANGHVIVSAVQIGVSGVGAIELVSMLGQPVDLSQWRIETVYSDGIQDWSCEQQLSGYMLDAKQQVTFVDSSAALSGASDAADPYKLDLRCGESKVGEVVAVDMWLNETRVEHVQLTAATPGIWARLGTTATRRTGVLTTDFKVDSLYQFHTTNLYFPAESAPLVITEVYSNPRLCTPIDSAALCNRYVKVRNASAAEVDLSRYRLRAGAQTTSSTTANTSALQGLVPAGATILLQKSASGVLLYLASSEGSVWFQDTHGLRDYSSGVTPYTSASTVKNTGLSWAYDASDTTWKWSIPSPDTAENIIRPPQDDAVQATSSSQVPCRDDQYRSTETNRCRSTTSASTQVACKDGQYRSEETNRCRSIALAGSTLVPCKDNQYRSEETNRCRSVALASQNLVACKDNQYRSEETNRCRTIASAAIPDAAFAVTPVKQTGKAFVGWWALGGVVVLAVGYGAWEWRREVLAGFRKISSVVTRRQ